MNINPVSLEAIELPLTRSARRIFGGTIHESGSSFRVTQWVNPVLELGDEMFGFWHSSRLLFNALCRPLDDLLFISIPGANTGWVDSLGRNFDTLLHESIQTRPSVA